MKNRRKPRLALIGTDSLRGKEIKDILEREKFPIQSMEFYDPDVEEEYSKLTQFRGEPKVIHHLAEDSLFGIDLAFLAAERKVSKKYGEIAQKEKIHAIDLSEAFNTSEKIPIIVAGVNDELLVKEMPFLIANPHPVTIILSHIFRIMLEVFGLRRAIAFVLQPVSAFDEQGIEELVSQSFAMLSSSSMKKKVFKDQIAFNLLSHTEPMDENGFSPVEKQIIKEIKRVLAPQEICLMLSLIQVPVFHTYSIMTHVEIEKKAEIQDLREAFKQSPYFKLSSSTLSCPVSSISVAGKDKIFIGQIKKEEADPRNFWIWAVADNLTLGSASNALEIAKVLFPGEDDSA